MTRRKRMEFPESVKRQALERAGWRCQDPLCGVSEEWQQLATQLRESEIVVPLQDDPAGDLPHPHVNALQDLILHERFRFPRVLNPIIKRFKLDGGALLEVDHEREDADGGLPVLGNAIVRCVFCHLFKTLERARTRRNAPKKPAPRVMPENTDLLTQVVLAPLREKLKLGRLDGGKAPVVTHSSNGANAARLEPRRHFTDGEFAAAARRRELAMLNNEEGC